MAALTLITFSTASPAAAETPPLENSIAIEIDEPAVEVGDTVAVTISAEELVDAYAYDLSIGYDPALLAFVDDSGVFPDGGFSTATAEAGVVSVVATRLGTSPGLTGSQTLVTVQFIALSAGEATVTLDAGSLVDSEGTVSDIAAGLSVSTVISAVDSGGGTDGGGGGTDGGSDGGSGDGGSSPGGSGALAGTGGESGPWIVAGVIALVASMTGVLLIIRRQLVER